MDKVTVRFRPIGATRRLKTSAYKVSPENDFGTLVSFLRRQLSLPGSEHVFCYVNQSFSPTLDAQIKDLYDNYGVEGSLNISYCSSVAFG